MNLVVYTYEQYHRNRDSGILHMQIVRHMSILKCTLESIKYLRLCNERMVTTVHNDIDIAGMFDIAINCT